MTTSGLPFEWSAKTVGVSRLKLLGLVLALFWTPSLCVFGQAQFDRTELDAWLQDERPEWTESQRTAFVDVLERQHETVLSTFAPDSAAHILKYAPDFALQLLSPQFESPVHFEILEEKYSLALEALAARRPYTEDEQKRVDEQVGLIEEAVQTALDEVAVGLPTQEALDEFNLITEERLQELRFAAACPLDPSFKSVLTDAELESVLEKIATRGKLSVEELQIKLAELEQERLEGFPSGLLTADVSMLIDQVITATETMTEVPVSERLKQLERKLTEDSTGRSQLRSIASWLDRERRSREMQAEFDRESAFLEAARTLQARAAVEAANPEEPVEAPDEPGPVDQGEVAPTPAPMQTGLPSVRYVGLGTATALLVFTGIYLFGRNRRSHG